MAHMRKMLVIEDCPSDVFILENMLSDSGCTDIEITNVARLIDAFQRIDKESFDVILLDLNLPDIDGVASIAALSAQLPNTPIIVYSGQDDPKLKVVAQMCGAAGYLVKGRETGRSLEYAIASAQNSKPH
jgi:DNA-binding NarL/FixJ family response regulator